MDQIPENNCRREEAVPSVKSHTSLTLDSPPSCLEFSPVDLGLFIVGTYQLHAKTEDGEHVQPKSQSRSGSIIAFRLKRHEISYCEVLETDYAVLDLHFSPIRHDVFAVATSIGTVELYTLPISQNGRVQNFQSISVCDPSVLVLSLSWVPFVGNEDEANMAVSLSNGRIVCLSADKAETSFSQAHSLEAWFVAWSSQTKTNENLLLYSGGDDSAFCKQRAKLTRSGLMVSDKQNELPDENTDHAEEPTYEIISHDAKTHGAGVTAILPLTVMQDGYEVVLTGSYDEYLRILVLNGPRRSQVLAEKCLHGGVWRLKALGSTEPDEDGEINFKLLASCMHAGARVLRVQRTKKGAWTIKVLAKFVEHESMNYASDARKNPPGEAGLLTIVSTSFYDRKLCIWSIEDT